MRKPMTTVVVTAAALLTLTAFTAAVGVSKASAGGGNSPAAKLCQKGGWQNLYRSDGSTFANEGACVSYAAQGGTLRSAPLTVDASLAFTQPSTHPFVDPYDDVTGDVTVHNGGSNNTLSFTLDGT